jgi:hypothetical protein
VKITQKQFVRVLVPGLGLTAFVITAYSATASSQVNTIHASRHIFATPFGATVPVAQITVNGQNVPLDGSGQTTISNDNGSTVHVSSDPVTTEPQSADRSTQTPSKTTVTITTGNQGQTTTSTPQDDSTNVHVYGNSSSYSSSYTNTSIYSTDDGLVQINQSN